MPRSRSLVPLLSMAVLAFVAASSGSAQLAQPPTGSGHGQKALTWTAPSEWTKEKPSSPLRRGQYRIPGPGPNYMLLGAVAEGPDANWFFRAIGPRDTLERQREAFERLVSSIKPGQ